MDDIFYPSIVINFALASSLKFFAPMQNIQILSSSINLFENEQHLSSIATTIAEHNRHYKKKGEYKLLNGQYYDANQTQTITVEEIPREKVSKFEEMLKKAIGTI